MDKKTSIMAKIPSITCMCLLFSLATTAQPTSLELAAVKAPIQQLFEGMRSGDTVAIRSAFLPGAGLSTVVQGPEGAARLRETLLDDFIRAMGTPHDEVYDERIARYDIQIDGPLATAWTPYFFYRGQAFSHCGVNAFQLLQTVDGWKIARVTDTRRREDCQDPGQDEEKIIHEFLDQWHQAAATADADAFFGAMTEDGIYLGTDATERWLRDELRIWAKAAFEREVAWAFTPSDRVIYFAPGQQTAWFEELLDTQMGTCRGSGVLTKVGSTWKVKHYDLAIMVPNEKVEAFKEMMKK